MTEHAAGSASNVEGKDIRGNVVTLKRTNPEQLSLFQTFLPDDDSNSRRPLERCLLLVFSSPAMSN